MGINVGFLCDNAIREVFYWLSHRRALKQLTTKIFLRRGASSKPGNIGTVKASSLVHEITTARRSFDTKKSAETEKFRRIFVIA